MHCILENKYLSVVILPVPWVMYFLIRIFSSIIYINVLFICAIIINYSLQDVQSIWFNEWKLVLNARIKDILLGYLETTKLLNTWKLSESRNIFLKRKKYKKGKNVVIFQWVLYFYVFQVNTVPVILQITIFLPFSEQYSW